MDFKTWFNSDPPPRIIRILDAVSQGVNTALLGGEANESVSGRCFRETVYEGKATGVWAWCYDAINRIAFWQEDHCKESYDGDLKRAERYSSRHKEYLKAKVMAEKASRKG